MVRLPALCTECGAVYPSPLRARTEGADVAFGVPVRCPGCGAGGRVPPEVLQRTRAVIETVRELRPDPGDAGPQLDAMEEAFRGAASREDAVLDALREAPELGRLAGSIPGEEPEQMAAALRLARLAVELVAEERPADDVPTAVLAERLLAEAYERWAPERPEEGEETPADRARKRLDAAGRNDPCPCGSGDKYKSCHWVEDLRTSRG